MIQQQIFVTVFFIIWFQLGIEGSFENLDMLKFKAKFVCYVLRTQ